MLPVIVVITSEQKQPTAPINGACVSNGLKE